MPHQCTSCGRTFEDGSKEMLSGCPDCGGNKFQFKPAKAVDGNAGNGTGGATSSAATASKKTPDSGLDSTDAGRDGSDSGQSAASDAPETGGDGRASAVDRAAATVRDWVGQRNDADSTGHERSARNDSARNDSARNDSARRAAEDAAQASARRDVVSRSELPDAPVRSRPPEERSDEAEVVGAPDDPTPGLKELREELNSQFESIRIVEPGQYELNLMELYEREEYIISLQEDGKYVIEVPDAWDAVER